MVHGHDATYRHVYILVELLVVQPQELGRSCATGAFGSEEFDQEVVWLDGRVFSISTGEAEKHIDLGPFKLGL
jgi:hypothetical protein